MMQRGVVLAQSMKCDGKTDDTAAFNSVIASAVTDNGPAAAPIELQTVQLPSGKCRFASPPKHIPAAIKILGNANRSGTWLIADYNEQDAENGFLTWDGSFRANGSGIGGGLEHVHISKGSGKTGGTAIKLIGIDDNHRAGFMLFNDLYINAVFGSAGFWHHHFIADGRCCMTKGSSGIRDIILSNFHFGQSRPPHEGDSILITNGIGFHIVNGLVFSSENGGIHITGTQEPSHYTLLSNVNVLGTLVIDNLDGLNFSGRISGKLITTQATKRCLINAVIEGPIANAGNCTVLTDQELSFSGILSGKDPDTVGVLILQNGTATHKFSHPHSTAPVCTASDNDVVAPVRVVADATQLTVTGGENHHVSYVCIARD